MTNCCFKFILLSVLVLLTINVVIAIFKNLAMLKFKMDTTIAPTLNLSFGWSNAKTPIPKNKNTNVSAEYAIVSYEIFNTFLEPSDMFYAAYIFKNIPFVKIATIPDKPSPSAMR